MSSILKNKTKQQPLILSSGTENDNHLLFSAFLDFSLLFRGILVSQDSREKLGPKEKL